MCVVRSGQSFGRAAVNRRPGLETELRLHPQESYITRHELSLCRTSVIAGGNPWLKSFSGQPRNTRGHHVSPRYSIVPGAAGYDARLTDFDCRVLLCIGRHTNAQGWCSISQKKLAAALGKSREATNRSIARLTKLQYLQKHDYRAAEHGDKRQNICVYRVMMDAALPPEVPMPENDLVIPGSQPLVTVPSQPLVTGGSQHNDLFSPSSQRDNNLKSESCSGGPCKKYASELSRGAAPTEEEDFQELALSFKRLDENHFLAPVLFKSEAYAQLGDMCKRWTPRYVEKAICNALTETKVSRKMRRGGIRAWSYFEGIVRDWAARHEAAKIGVELEECPW